MEIFIKLVEFVRTQFVIMQFELSKISEWLQENQIFIFEKFNQFFIFFFLVVIIFYVFSPLIKQMK